MTLRKHIKRLTDEQKGVNRYIATWQAPSGTIHAAALRMVMLCGLVAQIDGPVDERPKFWAMLRDDDEREVTCGNCVAVIDAVVDDFGDVG